MASIKINYLITEGPSKFDLMTSLFDGKTVEFTQKTDKNIVFKVKAIIQSVEAEDGSLNSWNLKIFVLPDSNANIPKSKSFLAYYNSRTRKGTVKIT